MPYLEEQTEYREYGGVFVIRSVFPLPTAGIQYLRNGWYTENYTASVPAALKNGALLAVQPTISSAPRADYAEAAAVVLTTPACDGKTYELAGDNAYTLSDLAAEISKQSGQEIPYADISEEAYAQACLPEGEARFASGLRTLEMQGFQQPLKQS